MPCKPLILYIAAQEKSLGTLYVQENGEQKEVTLYCLRRLLVDAELMYSPIDKIFLLLIFSIQRLRHYKQAYAVQMVSKANPIEYMTTETCAISDKNYSSLNFTFSSLNNLAMKQR